MCIRDRFTLVWKTTTLTTTSTHLKQQVPTCLQKSSKTVSYTHLDVYKRQDFVDTYEEYTVAPVIQACTYHADANLYGALVNWLQEENQW